MSVIQVIPDPFAAISNQLNKQGSTAGNYVNGKPFIRRPTRGIEIKEDTFATIRVAVAAGNQNLSLVDAGSRRVYATDAPDGSYKAGDPIMVMGKRATDIYSNFLLQQVQEERMEKQQILETFGEPYIFLFGERARVITFQGILINTFDFNWEAEWWFNYDNFLRGTKCVENDARAFISFDETIVGGYIIASSTSKNSVDKNHVNFQFQIFVTSYTNFSAVGDPNAQPGFTANGVTLAFRPIISEAEAAPYRPDLLTSRVSTQGTGPLSGVNQTPTLAAGLEAGIQQVTNTWNQVNQIVNSALSGVNNFQNGSNIRIPYGFAGTMAFDDSSDALLYTVGYGLSIKYSVFSDNDDEYVGVGDHYGSSQVRLGLGGTLISDVISYNQKLVDKANQVWQAKGFSIPPFQLGPVSQFIVGKGLGLLAVGASSAWTAFSHTTVPGSANGSFGAGLGPGTVLPT